MNRYNPREMITVILIPVVILLAVGLLYFRDNPNSTFKGYQQALVSKDWGKALKLSDETTQAYLTSLNDWVWTGNMTDMASLEAFQQFLILSTRCRVLAEQRKRPTESDLLGIWLEALQLNRLVARSKVINRYNFGESSIGQLYLKQTSSTTGLQIHFIDQGTWKIKTMTLIKEAYDQAAVDGSKPLLQAANQDYFDKGFTSQHLMPLKFQLGQDL
jgi:hypothetical protein